VVALAVPLKLTEEVATKPVPFTVRVKAAPPAVAPVGKSEVMVGTGLFTMKLDAAEAPPPGAGFVTTTGNVPAAAISGAVTATVTCVAFTNVVVLAAPLNVALAPLTKLVPLTVRVKATPPAVALDGTSELIVGTGLFTAKLVAAEVPPPGAALVTVTGKDPAMAMSAAVIAAVTCVALTNVVVLALPLNCTEEDATNPVPLTVRVKAAPPAVALVGEREVIVGAGLLTAKFVGAEAPPPGAGLLTTTGKLAAAAMSAAVTAMVT